MRTIWAARRNADSTEGRGPMIVIGMFEDQQAATRAASGWGVMGVGDGDVEPMIVYESFREYNDEKTKELKNKALAKLTREDREVLGLR
jgi:hypothetical protein